MKVTAARKQHRADGTWDVALEIDTRKRYADGEGRESEAALDEPSTSGSLRPNRAGRTSARIRSGLQTLNLVTAREPLCAGVDPYNKRVDRNSEDNVRATDLAP